MPQFRIGGRIGLYGSLILAAVVFVAPLSPPGAGNTHAVTLDGSVSTGHIREKAWFWLTVREGPEPLAARFLPNWSTQREPSDQDAPMRESAIVAYTIVQSLLGRQQGKALLVRDPVSSSASPLVRPGDSITHINGRRISSLASFHEQVAGSTGPVRLRVLRSGGALSVNVEPVSTPRLPHIGYMLAESFMPPPLTPVTGSVQGSSAGLLFSLMYADIEFPGDLAAGRLIAATGSVTPTGEVLPVSGVISKVRAAQDAGVDLIFVPRDNFAQVQGATAGPATVVPVSTVGEALYVLCAFSSDPFCTYVGSRQYVHS